MKLTPTFRYRHFVFTGMLALALSFNAVDQVFVGLLHAQDAPSGANVEKDAATGKQVVTTPSGLKYVDLVPGTGAAVKEGDAVEVKYVGKLTDGTTFDASERHPPGTFKYVQGKTGLIAGWTEGTSTMKVGGKRKLIIPPQLGYGAQEVGGVIPANSTLIFEIELVSSKPAGN